MGKTLITIYREFSRHGFLKYSDSVWITVSLHIRLGIYYILLLGR